ncbi:MAG: response regulator transcription factor [Ignavibacteriales bacterium]|nr:response regulator transcription factor [Ignavibacteriales bacterium]MCF8306952.1 response regulator transcription factor [Ignavibacteriales bacterium]MCF8437392.1 response regulator transcription factor [Ignavibacteriales bacterium]
MKKIKILLIEDNRLLRDGIDLLLKSQQDMEVVASAGNGETILKLLKKHKAEIVLLDLGLRNRNSLQIVKQIKKNFNSVNVIVMDLIPIETDVYDFVKAGVSGFILKDANISDFYSTLRTVSKGGQVLPPNLTSTLFSQIIQHAVNGFDPETIIESVRITTREREVIELISDGFSNKEIAQKLNLSPYTIKSHVHNILEKLALNSRLQIAKHAHISKAIEAAKNDTSLIDG